ncbi:patatin-like phospholipase family protein [Alkalibacter rhizosphaerae]|uniref:Patatin-like phospholipase family protein n=1 Tax=Alkalibacter rhizosphaerae TaxID=2815577 RepID=A0A974XGE0_9FIRM|nr:patatin-like phospholipase family protein [Alkalibacter rhizosphaerae]QSX08150.1 patatin-like phospholipase family protein [Alkalibacter rhizosphaerae]
MWGIVLEGGGAKGAYQMGIWKAVRELGIAYDAVVGTSVGALNAAMMVQGDFEIAMDLWRSITPEKIYLDPDGIVEKLMNYEFQAQHYGDLHDEMVNNLHTDGLDPSPFVDLIQKHVDEDRIRKTFVDFGLVAIDMDKEQGLELFKKDIPKGQLANLLLASCYLPVFKDRTIGGKCYMDGGFYNNLPVNMLVEAGWKNIIVVKLRQPPDDLEVPKDVQVIQLVPSEDLGRTLDFDNQRILDNIRLGYLDGMKALAVL